ncbi:hypothetical protein [Anaerobiospirillum thomasii]|nr:hypothetical protein [Anaerobiospirillum thomasii]
MKQDAKLRYQKPHHLQYQVVELTRADPSLVKARSVANKKGEATMPT